jgi:hypothetical protein
VKQQTAMKFCPIAFSTLAHLSTPGAHLAPGVDFLCQKTLFA